MVQTAVAVSQRWPDSAVWSAPSVKPLNEEQVTAICRQHVAVIVLEEHSVYGGLGSAVAEIAAARAPTWVCRVGVQDRFSQLCGSYAYLMEEHGLDAEAVHQQVQAFVARLTESKTAGRSAA
jgi:transketolase